MQIGYRQDVINELYFKYSLNNKFTGERVEQDDSELTDSDRELLHSLDNHQKFQQLYQGDTSNYASSSEADMTLCCILAIRTRDSRQIDRLVRSSGLYRDKWDSLRNGKTYGAITIGSALVRTKEAQAQSQKGFKLIHVGHLLEQDLDARWLIEDTIHENALITLFGLPGTLKTFMAFSWCLAITSGANWFGREVKQGPVVYIAAEGFDGIPKRIKAWEAGTGVDASKIPLFFSSAPAQMLDKSSAESVAQSIREIAKEHGEPVAVFFDTMARNFGPGDENSTRDMTQFISHLDEYIGMNCAKILIHHSGHNESGRGRGSSALNAALDQEYRTKKLGNGYVELYNTKQKDAEEWPNAIKFKSQSVVVGEDRKGKPVTSLYLTYAGESLGKQNSLTGKKNDILDTLVRMYGKEANRLDSQGGEKAEARVCKLEWRRECICDDIAGKTHVYKVTDELIELGYVTEEGEYVYPVSDRSGNLK